MLLLCPDFVTVLGAPWLPDIQTREVLLLKLAVRSVKPRYSF